MRLLPLLLLLAACAMPPAPEAPEPPRIGIGGSTSVLMGVSRR